LFSQLFSLQVTHSRDFSLSLSLLVGLSELQHLTSGRELSVTFLLSACNCECLESSFVNLAQRMEDSCPHFISLFRLILQHFGCAFFVHDTRFKIEKCNCVCSHILTYLTWRLYLGHLLSYILPTVRQHHPHWPKGYKLFAFVAFCFAEKKKIK
jgi:hypothetical protein